MNSALIDAKPFAKLCLAFLRPLPRRSNLISGDHGTVLCVTHSSVNAQRINAYRIVRAMHKEKDWRSLRSPSERLVWARENAGYETPADAASALGMEGSKASTYFGHENGSRGLARAGARYAEFFRVRYDWLMLGKGAPNASAARRGPTEHTSPEDEVKIVGRSVAGAEETLIFDEETDLGTAPMPPGGSETTVAVEVWGNSMRPIAYDGWLIYYDDRRGGLTPDMIGQPCVITLASGQTLVKTPYSGSKRGLYNLESANPAVDTLRDQRVKWAALVTAIVPRRATHKLNKQIKGEASL